MEDIVEILHVTRKGSMMNTLEKLHTHAHAHMHARARAHTQTYIYIYNETKLTIKSTINAW
jgi:hypothetical protein